MRRFEGIEELIEILEETLIRKISSLKMVRGLEVKSERKSLVNSTSSSRTN